MSRFHRRLAALERAMQAPAVEAQVTALSLHNDGPDLMFVGQEWLPCPNVPAILARRNPAVKVYLGLAPDDV